MSDTSDRKRDLQQKIGADGRAQLKRLKKRIRTRRISGFVVGWVLYFLGGTLLVFAIIYPDLNGAARWGMGILSVIALIGCFYFVRLAFAPRFDIEDKLADKLESFYIYLANYTPLWSELTWREVINRRLGELAALMWRMPAHLNTSNPDVIKEANRIAGGLLAKQKRVSFDGSAGMQEELEKWSLQAMKSFLEGDWQSIDDYTGKPVKPPKMSKIQRRSLLIIAVTIMTIGLAVIATAALVGGATAGSVGVIAAAPIFLIARHFFSLADINVDSIINDQAMARNFLPRDSGDESDGDHNSATLTN